MTPVMLDEKLVCPFKFYFLDEVQLGMRHETGLYGFVEEFSSQYRLAAYQFACELAEQNFSIVITVSKHTYKVWAELDASTYPQLKKLRDQALTPLLVA